MPVLAKHHGIRVIELDNGTRPIEVVKQSVIGIIGTAPDADAVAFPLDENILIISNLEQAAKLGRDGTLLTQIESIFAQGGATIIVRRIDVGIDAAATLANVVGDLATKTGIYGFLDASSNVKVEPKILIAPSFTMAYTGVLKNPAAVALQTMADKLRGICILEATNTSKEAAVAYRDLHGHERSYIIAQSVKIYDTASQTSLDKSVVGAVAGLIVKRDKSVGTHHSPSNQIINGITGVNRAVDFKLSDPDSEATYLDNNQVNCIVSIQGDLKLWGNEMATNDTSKRFINVRRTADLIADSVEEAFVWAMDKPNTSGLAHEVIERVGAFLRIMINGGAILGGEVWFDKSLNPIDALMQGALSVSFDQEVPAPMKDLRFYMSRNSDYYLQEFDQLKAA
ncbi:MAG: phage tail protein [Rhizobiales bacterium]|nr:phage tail protein [Hyphomicrobiales bacterium]